MTVSRSRFGSLPDGREVTVFAIENASGYELSCTDYGATLVSFRAPGARGTEELTLGYPDLAGYLAGHPYFGSTVGRVANRIGGAAYTYAGKRYDLVANQGRNMLHGGPDGFHARLWEASAVERPGQAGIVFHLLSPDGDQGFPGRLSVTVTITLTDANELLFEYYAESDAVTPVNLTNHAYWNLAGAPDLRRAAGLPTADDPSTGGAVGDHVLTIPATGYVELDAEQIPTGRIVPVDATPFDFHAPRRIGESIAQAGGYDLSYALQGGEEVGMAGGDLRRAALVEEPTTGRSMEVLTTLPAVQLYTAEVLRGTPGRSGQTHLQRDTLCLETQFQPDSVNHPEFGPIMLEPGEQFRHKTVHRFSSR